MTALRVDLGETGMKQNKTIFQIVSGCLLALLLPAWAFALNLGEINLMSEPGEPLEAEILLSGVKAGEQDSLSVGLADVAGFRWAGIAWSPALNQLQFELKRGADGRDYIGIRSDEPIRAASLHFLLKVAWSRGRLFREYTLELGAQAADPDAIKRKTWRQNPRPYPLQGATGPRPGQRSALPAITTLPGAILYGHLPANCVRTRPSPSSR